MTNPSGPNTLSSNVGLRVAQNATAILVARGTSLVLSACALSLLGRCLDVANFGTYSLIYAYLALFAWLAGFGLQPIVTRECSRDRDNARSIIHTAAVLCLACGLVTTIIALACSPLAQIPRSVVPILAIAAIEVFLLAPLMIYGTIFQVDLRQWYGSTFNVVRSLLWCFLLVGIYLAGVGLPYIVGARFAAAAIESVLNWRFALRHLPTRGEFLGPIARKLFTSGFPLAFAGFAGLIYLRIDQVMLHRMVGDEALGHYAAAVRISELFEALPAAFATSLFPVLCSSVQDPIRFRRYLDLGYRYMVVAASAISLVVCITAQTIVSMFYGSKFSASAPLLAVLIWSEVPVFFSSILINGLLATDAHAQMIWPTLVGASVNVVLNLFAIPRWGAMGATMATVVAYSTAWIVVPICTRKARNISGIGIKKSILIIMSALLSILIAFQIVASQGRRLPTAIGLFVVGLVSLRLVRREDFHFLRQTGASLLGRAKSHSN